MRPGDWVFEVKVGWLVCRFAALAESNGRIRASDAMGKKTAAPKTETKAVKAEIDAVPGFVGRVIKPGQTLSWNSEVEEFVLQLNSAALGLKVQDGRTTLFASAKGSETALCTLAPKSAEQWNLTHTFTAFDGPVDFRCEGVNEIHLTGFIDVQEEEDSEDEHEHGEECGEECAHGHEGFEDDSEDDDDDEVMIFGDQSGSSDDDEDDEEEEEDSDRFEVIEERSHGEGWANKDEKKKPAAEKKAAVVEKTPAKKDAKKKAEASPAAKETKAATPKESPAAKKADAKSEKKAAEKEKKVAEKIAELTATTNAKKRPAPSESVEVPKKAKNLREHKGVTIEEQYVAQLP